MRKTLATILLGICTSVLNMLPLDSLADTNYRVKKDDTLSGIALAHYGDANKYPLIARANPEIKAPKFTVHPGQEIVIPDLTPNARPIVDSTPTAIPTSQDSEKNLTLSQGGLDFIKKYESFSPVAYNDVGKYSIGYGHQIREGESFGRITEEEAEKLLRKDVKKAEDAVLRNIHVQLTQGQFDALVSFVYNLGEGALVGRTITRRLNNRDYQGASEEFSRWIYAGGEKLRGLEIRRSEEAQLFNSGN